MSLKRRSLLSLLALLTLIFLGFAAYTFFGNPFRREPLSVQTLPLGKAPQALRLTVYDTGIAAVTVQELRSTNLPFTELTAESIQLTRDGEMVPFYIAGEGDEATLYFYAQAITRSMEAPAVYWLMPGRGKTMSQSDQSPEGAGVTHGIQWRHWEENRTFLGRATGDDNWLGPNVFAPGSLEIPLSDIQPSGGPGKLEIRMWSSNQHSADPDHHMVVSLNEIQVMNHFWDGISQETLSIPLSSGALQETDNQLHLEVPGDTGAAGESIYLDWVKLEYEGELNLGNGQLLFRSNARNVTVLGATEETLVFDVTDRQAPVLFINTEFEDNRISFAGNGPSSTYVVMNPREALRPIIDPAPDWNTALRSAEQGADYIVIVPNESGYEEALTPLLEHRAQQGLRVMMVPLQQIYDEFSYGRQRPEAIRDFLEYAVQNWQHPSPQFVLLVGDATYDQYNYTNSRNRNLIPTYLVYTYYAGYVASDTWYTIFREDIPQPSLAIGRLPAQTLAQLKIMVKKIIDYETTAKREWLTRALLVADDESRFNTASDWLANELSNRGYRPQKLYMTENEEIHDAIISALNHGVGIVNYVGHGGIEVWGDETVLRTQDASMLRNATRLPVFTTFTCLNGYFNHPDVDALAETLLWTENGGIVAAVAPSGRTPPPQQTPLANTFYQQLLSGEVQTLGEALLRAKQIAAEDPNLGEVVHTFNLLGDPALRFQPAQQLEPEG